MSDFLTTPGFLGTSATLRSDLTLVLILITAILFNLGFLLARRKRYVFHRWVQTSAVILNTVVVLVSMVTSFIVHILPGIPGKLGEGDYAVTTVHGIIGAIGLTFGVFVALRGNELVPQRLKFRNYRPFMRWAYALYMLATLGGVALYIIVFVLGI
ncbi:MAG TPA: hypothetical protein VF831_07845 [Anaerolineales bacterium]